MDETTNNNKKQSTLKRYLPLVLGSLLGIGIITWTSYQVKNSTGDRDPSELFANKKAAENVGMCGTPEPPVHACFKAKSGLCEDDLKTARIAWTYYENNYQPKTGLVNSANQYPSTTMWDTGSALAATIAAHDFGFIDQKDQNMKLTQVRFCHVGTTTV